MTGVTVGPSRRWGLSAVILGAVMTFATGCSPGQNAVIGIGFDHNGDLVGVLNVCSRNITKAQLSPTHDPTQPDSPAEWSCHTPLTGLEAWRLDASETTNWRRTGPATAIVASKHYQFTAQNSSDSYHSDLVDVDGRDLLALHPGQVLVDRDGPKDPHGIPAFATPSDAPKRP